MLNCHPNSGYLRYQLDVELGISLLFFATCSPCQSISNPQWQRRRPSSAHAPTPRSGLGFSQIRRMSFSSCHALGEMDERNMSQTLRGLPSQPRTKSLTESWNTSFLQKGPFSLGGVHGRGQEGSTRTSRSKFDSLSRRLGHAIEIRKPVPERNETANRLARQWIAKLYWFR